MNPMMCFSETDFPTPLRPMITHVSARFTLKLTSFSTALSSNDLQTSRNSKKFSALRLAAAAGSSGVHQSGRSARPARLHRRHTAIHIVCVRHCALSSSLDVRARLLARCSQRPLSCSASTIRRASS